MKEITPEHVVVVQDSREQIPYNLAPLKMEPGTLSTGDYSVKGLEQFVAVERKSLEDLIGCVGLERERFEREMQRLLAYPSRLLVVEASWADILAGNWRSKVNVASATGSILGWMAMGIPFLFAGSRAEAQHATARFLFIAARRRWREAQAFCETLKLEKIG